MIAKSLDKWRMDSRGRRRTRRRARGLSLVEVLISLAIMALLLTATAVAFDAAIGNYRTNHDLATVSVSARNALYQMCSTIRSAWNDPNSADTTMTVNTAGTQCTMKDSADRDIIYRYDSNSKQLQVNVNGSGNWYTLVENVYPVTVGDRIFTESEPETGKFPAGTVGRIEIRFMVSQAGVCRTISASAVPRNVLY
jgi:prepilin-type N-terminal cleavage/methylation domain-containing protein